MKKNTKYYVIIGVLLGAIVIVGIIIAVAATQNTDAKVIDNKTANTTSTANITTTTTKQLPRTFKVGDVIEIGGTHTITILSMADYPGEDYFKPKVGNKYLSLEIEQSNISSEPIDYNPLYFNLRDKKGFSYSMSFSGKDPRFQSGKLAPDKNVRGFVTFEISKDLEIDELEYNNTAILGFQPIYIKLSK